MITMDTNIHNARQFKVVRCNECKQAVRVDQCANHYATCEKIKLKQRFNRVVVERDGLLMYAIACAEYQGPEDYNLQIHYVHAEDGAHARAQFCYAHPNRTTHVIMGVGLVIGWLADEKEKILIH